MAAGTRIYGAWSRRNAQAYGPCSVRPQCDLRTSPQDTHHWRRLEQLLAVADVGYADPARDLVVNEGDARGARPASLVWCKCGTDTPCAGAATPLRDHPKLNAVLALVARCRPRWGTGGVVCAPRGSARAAGVAAGVATAPPDVYSAVSALELRLGRTAFVVPFGSGGAAVEFGWMTSAVF